MFCLQEEKRQSTAQSYEGALKTFVKYQKKLVNESDNVIIKTLLERNEKDVRKGSEASLLILDQFKKYDIPVKAISAEMMKDFKAYLSRSRSKNTVGIVLRSINAILNNAGSSYEDIKGHEPFAGIKKGSHEKSPAPLKLQEIDLLQGLKLEEGTSGFHALNYFLFMFDNMGMNFFDIALL